MGKFLEGLQAVSKMTCRCGFPLAIAPPISSFPNSRFLPQWEGQKKRRVGLGPSEGQGEGGAARAGSEQQSSSETRKPHLLEASPSPLKRTGKFANLSDDICRQMKDGLLTSLKCLSFQWVQLVFLKKKYLRKFFFWKISGMFCYLVSILP